MEFHPVASIFPIMGQEEFNELKADIEANGLLEPIWVDKDNLIIDGRNRYMACDELDIKPEYRTFTGDGSLVDFVVSLSLKRRHLNSTQKAFVGLKVLEFFEAEAKERQIAAGAFGAEGGRGNKKEETLSQNFEQGFFDDEPEPIPMSPPIKTNINETKAATQAAKTVGSNRQYMSDAKKVEATAPRVAEVAKAGKIVMSDALKIAKMPETEQDVVLEKVGTGLKPSDAIRETVRETVKAELESVEMVTAKAIEGVYDVIVIDPPWPMVKIERDVTPTQVAFDYPTMSLEEISQMSIPFAEDCHVWVWTTQKFLPHALNIIKSWGLKYVCCFVWHKNGGFQPIGLPQYNCEFILYCRKGSPQLLDTKDLPTCFNAPRGNHSEKPEIFYDFVRRITAGRRLDMFNRRWIDGFDTWGKEAA